MEMRATMRSARGKGTGGARHSDRNFDLDKASHIDQNRTAENEYYQLCHDEHGFKLKQVESPDFENQERKIYKDTFADWMEAKNERYIKQRHPERCQNIDDLYDNPMKKPDETLFQVGDMSRHMDGATLRDLAMQQMQWEEQHYPGVKYLNVSLHLDESTPHIHARRVFLNADRYGYCEPNESGFMRKNNINRPDMSKAESRYNCPKMTFTEQCREHWLELVKERVPELETEPQAPKKHLDRTDYIIQHQAEQLQANQQQMMNMQLELQQHAAEIEKAQHVKQMELQKLDKLHQAKMQAESEIAIAREQIEITKSKAKDPMQIKKQMVGSHYIITEEDRKHIRNMESLVVQIDAYKELAEQGEYVIQNRDKIISDAQQKAKEIQQESFNAKAHRLDKEHKLERENTAIKKIIKSDPDLLKHFQHVEQSLHQQAAELKKSRDMDSPELSR